MLEARIPIVGVGAAVAMLCGALAVHALPALPSRGVDVALAAVAVLALSRPRLRAVGWLLLGFAW
jgi:competence protein ComEC